MYILWRIANVMYCIFCSILTKKRSEKYTTDMKFIYYANCRYLFCCILVYGSLLFLSAAHMMKQEISKGRNYFCFKYDKTDNSNQPSSSSSAWWRLLSGACLAWQYFINFHFLQFLINFHFLQFFFSFYLV